MTMTGRVIMAIFLGWVVGVPFVWGTAGGEAAVVAAVVWPLLMIGAGILQAQVDTRKPESVWANPPLRPVYRPRTRHVSQSVKNAVVLRDQGRCGLCGKACHPAEIEFDHIIPFSMGGTNTVENLRVACASCNRERGAGNFY